MVQGGGSGGREFENEEGPHLCHGRGQHYQGKGEGSGWQPKGWEAVDPKERRKNPGYKERVKTIAAKSVKAFQQTDEYNTVLFN